MGEFISPFYLELAMPLYASAFFLPTSQAIPYLMEDVYIRGGFRSMATIADRDAIRPAARKKGMVVYVQEDDTIYWIPGPATAGAAAWKKWDVTKYVNFILDNPLLLTENEETGERTLSIEPTRVVPVISEDEADYVLLAGAEGPVWAKKLFIPDTTGATAGQTVVLNADGEIVWSKVDGLPEIGDAVAGDVIVLDAERNPVWGKSSGLPDYSNASIGHALIINEEGKPTWAKANGLPSTDGVAPGSIIRLNDSGEPEWADGSTLTPKRQVLTVPLDTIIVEGTAEVVVDLPCSTLTMVSVGLSHPDLLLELHTSEDYSDSNPYGFRSSLIKLEDDGLTVDGETVVRSRRYSIFSCPNPENKKMYVKVTNEGLASVEATLTIAYVPMEF